MRLLVTGAAGFLGRNALLAMPHSWQVIALYRPGNSDFQRFLAAHRLSHVQGVACDLTDRQQVALVAEQWGRDFQGCLAFASNTSIPLSIEQPVYDLTTNTIGLLHLLEHCSFEHLVYLSSGAVYVGRTGLVGPASAVSPHLPYAISKLAAEQYIQAFALHHHNPQHATIVRFFGAYGPYEPARKLYTKLVRRFAFERDPHFTVIGDGENYIDAMYVGDAIKALLAVLARSPEESVRCVDLGLGSGESINQIVTRAAHTFGLEPRISHEGATAEYINFFIDPQPFASLYQFMPTTTLEDGLQLLAAHLKQEQEGKHG
ncbi:MAG TPA: NAD(P)-dependent oxidoreductase [Ktedonosporobacter sp.]|nr:NAD(P)-dependent oxidoreductase [Ktedonosporobacter sp.]